MPLHSAIAYLIFAFVLALLFGATAWDKRYSRVGWFLIFCTLWLFAGLRVGVGRDFEVYYWAYYTPKWDSSEAMEPLWQGAYELFRLLHTEYAGMQLAVTAVMAALAVTVMRRLSLTPLLSLLSFVVIYSGYFESMNTVRQMMATLLLLATFPLFLKKRYWAYLFYMVLAYLVHRSAVIFPLLLVITRIPLNKYAGIGALLLSLAVGTPLLEYIADILVAVLPKRYGTYIVSQMLPPDQASGIYRLFLNLFAALLLWLSHRWREHKPTQLYIRMFFWAVIIYNCTITFEVGMRFMGYPFAFIYPLLGNIFALDRTKVGRALVYGALLAFFFFGTKSLLNPKEPYIKYQTIFHDMHYDPNVW